MLEAHRDFIQAVQRANKTFHEDWEVFSHRFRMAWMYLDIHKRLIGSPEDYLASQIDSAYWVDLPDIVMVTLSLIGSPEDLDAGPHRDALQGVYDAWRALCKAKKQEAAPEVASCE